MTIPLLRLSLALSIPCSLFGSWHCSLPARSAHAEPAGSVVWTDETACSVDFNGDLVVDGEDLTRLLASAR